jgi:hypothetical protein
MNKEDTIADVEMCFRQIISLTDLILECNNNEIVPTILIIRDLAYSGLNKFMKIADKV